MTIDPHSPTNAAVAAGFRGFAWLLGWLTVAVGALVLLGWAFAIEAFTALLPGATAMKANTALLFVASGAALLMFLRGRRGAPRELRVCGGLSLLVVVMAATTLSQTLFGFELGIDTLLVEDPMAGQRGLPPGRMSELTAVGFILLGSHAMLACAGWDVRLRDALALAVAAVGMIGLASFGYAAGQGGSSSLPFAPVPIHTALLLLLNALAWMSAEPAQGMTRLATADSAGGTMARRLLLPSLLLPLLIGFLRQWLQTTLQVEEALIAAVVALLTGGTVASLVWWVSHLLDRVEREQREAQRMRDSAQTDGLTGLANRRAFDAALQRLLQGHREKDAQFSLLMIDIDHFKRYNDDFGHLAGDEALRIAARLLRGAVRPGDLAARYGGEEFALLLPESDAAAALQVAERVLRAFRAHTWPQRPVTVSIGVAEATPGDADVLIARADAALYRAKHAGRDRALSAAATPNGSLNLASSRSI